MIHDSSDDDDSQPLQPEEMYISPIEYIKSCTLPTRCRVTQTVEYLEKFLEEMKWFRNHDQFKHVFHMRKQPNHMIQGMWMLLVRTAKTHMERECWFVVNGVPIRYSMREHTLLTIFSCHEYLDNWTELRGLKFSEKVFEKTKGIKIKDVEEQLDKMMSKSST